MKIHRVKCIGHWFEQCVTGEKPFEVRKNDRDYKTGDLIELKEFVDRTMTGRAATFRITSVLFWRDFPAGLRDDYVVLGLAPVTGLYEEGK